MQAVKMINPAYIAQYSTISDLLYYSYLKGIPIDPDALMATCMRHRRVLWPCHSIVKDDVEPRLVATYAVFDDDFLYAVAHIGYVGPTVLRMMTSYYSNPIKLSIPSLGYEKIVPFIRLVNDSRSHGSIRDKSLGRALARIFSTMLTEKYGYTVRHQELDYDYTLSLLDDYADECPKTEEWYECRYFSKSNKIKCYLKYRCR